MNDSDKIIFEVVSDEEYEKLQESEHDGWHKITDYDCMVKWQYKDSPYRVVAAINENRGHWFASFTSSYSRAHSALIRGNLGGGLTGRRKAIAAAKQFLEENKNGCPPPGEIDL